MSGLLYKNFFLYRIELIVIGVLQIICSFTVILNSAQTGGSEETMLLNMIVHFNMFFLTSLFDSGLFANDEKRVATCFAISTPKGAKSQVQSKYYTLLIVNLAVLFFCFVTDVICCVIMDSVLYSCASFLIIFFSFSIILTVFGVPFIIRFGSNNGGNVKISTVGVLILLIGIYILFGDIAFFMADDPVAELMKLLTAENVMLVLSFIPYAAIILYYISYRISLALYRKGAENYD